MRRKTPPIKPGDRFQKVSAYPTQWTVTRLIDLEDMPPHLHIALDNSHRVLTFSASALLDESLFRRLPAEKEAAAVGKAWQVIPGRAAPARQRARPGSLARFGGWFGNSKKRSAFG